MNLILLNRHCLANVWVEQTKELQDQQASNPELKDLYKQFEVVKKQLVGKFPKRSFLLSDHVRNQERLFAYELLVPFTFEYNPFFLYLFECSLFFMEMKIEVSINSHASKKEN